MAVTREQIPLEQIRMEDGVRDEPSRRMMKSVNSVGQEREIRLRRVGPDAYEVLHGHRLLALARREKWPLIDAVVVTERDAAGSTSQQVLEVDAQHENLRLLRKALHVSRRIREEGGTPAELAKQLGGTRAYVSAMLQVVECPDLVAFMNEEELEFGAAKPLARLTEAERAELLQELRWYRMREDRFPPAREIERWVAKRLGEEPFPELDLEGLARRQAALEAAGFRVVTEVRSGRQDTVRLTVTVSRGSRERLRTLLSGDDGSGTESAP